MSEIDDQAGTSHLYSEHPRTGETGTPNQTSSDPVVGYCQNCGRGLNATTARVVGQATYCEPCLAAKLGGAPAWTATTAGASAGQSSGSVDANARASGWAAGPVSKLLQSDAPQCRIRILPRCSVSFPALAPCTRQRQYPKGIVHLVVFVVLVSLTERMGCSASSSPAGNFTWLSTPSTPPGRDETGCRCRTRSVSTTLESGLALAGPGRAASMRRDFQGMDPRHRTRRLPARKGFPILRRLRQPGAPPMDSRARTIPRNRHPSGLRRNNMHRTCARRPTSRPAAMRSPACRRARRQPRRTPRFLPWTPDCLRFPLRRRTAFPQARCG